MGAPLVTEEAGVRVDVAVGGGVARAGVSGTILRVSAVGVLGPEAVEDEGRATGALRCVRVRVAELGRPGEVEEVVVERLVSGGLDGDWGGAWARSWLGRRLRRWGAGGEDKKNE